MNCRCRFVRPQSDASYARGFTLLEIMVVLVIIAAISAIAIPHLFSSPERRLKDEGRHLASLLRLAEEEAQLRGVPIRWTAFADRYRFELPDADGAWQVMRERPFAPRSLPKGMRIESVRLQDGMPQPNESRDDHSPLGHVTLFPDGMLSVGEVVVAEGAKHLRIVLRPGPGGIHVAKGAS